MPTLLDLRVYLPRHRHGKNSTGTLKTIQEIRTELQEAFAEDATTANNSEPQRSFPATISRYHSIEAFHDISFADGTLKRDDTLQEVLAGNPADYPLNRVISGYSKACLYLQAVTDVGAPPKAVSFLYSPGKRKKRQKAWVVATSHEI